MPPAVVELVRPAKRCYTGRSLYSTSVVILFLMTIINHLLSNRWVSNLSIHVTKHTIIFANIHGGYPIVQVKKNKLPGVRSIDTVARSLRRKSYELRLLQFLLRNSFIAWPLYFFDSRNYLRFSSSLVSILICKSSPNRKRLCHYYNNAVVKIINS